MAITIQIPPEIERQLRDGDPQLDQHARDQFLLSQYAAGKISTGDIAIIIGLETRLQAEDWLASHQMRRNYSMDDLDADQRTIDHLLGPGKS